MDLGITGDEIKLVNYTDEWKKEFSKVKHEIKENTHIEANRIEHIGSTAIEGMVSKPVIDILVAVDDLNAVEKRITDDFKSIGFLRLKVERPGEIIFAKFTDSTFQKRTHYIHLVEYEKGIWNNLIFFRDYLNANEEAKVEYKNLKLDYAKKHSVGIKKYTDHKESFVKGVFKKRK
ncbi:GrpB family protein [Bacillus hominis]|uniref:GrpB family protein n=1 Tax=Bacillus hominis TaxID=2817478 RepID=A0ABT7R2M0_9BACI|nr:GrpB family protein [Bacillus hominis]MDM5192011.1 GrpB family protein [Bacillus hominis]MDM5431742.1 GrpB family protein [Bacillus hominis]MDM5437177.1 GrpB family protein [Bacillus hominis]